MTELSSPGTVLAVVSDLILRQKVVEGLSAAGFEVQVAGGPTVMRERLSAQRPLAVLIDLENRGMDAIELISELKADPETASIPLLGFFGHVNIDIRTRALAAGCDRVATRGEVASRLDRLMEKLLPV